MVNLLDLSPKCAELDFWIFGFFFTLALIEPLYTGCLNLLCPTSNQDFFKQKALILGILSRGDLCLIHDLLIFILYSASTASDLQGVKIQVI